MSLNMLRIVMTALIRPPPKPKNTINLDLCSVENICFSFNLVEDGSPCLALEIPAHMSQSYQCMRHYIMTMSQTLTKPAWPRATTCVTTAGWKYHSSIPLPPLYFGMTKRQFVGRAQNHKSLCGFCASYPPLSHPCSVFFIPKLHLFPLPVSVKSQWSNALT